jgi:hypothetical protein
MKRRSFLKSSALVAGGASVIVPAMGGDQNVPVDKKLFELRVYHLSGNANAKKALEQYFTDTLIPFLNRHDVKFGAFNEYSLEEPAKLHVLLAYPSSSAYFKVQSGMISDAAFLEASKDYANPEPAEDVYTRYETFLLDAFDSFPSLSVSDEKKGLFELRIYESINEDAGNRKVDMFNKEEIAVFLKVGMLPVFFGRILAGQYMPGLIYMLGFKDMGDRDSAWGRFSVDNDWKIMSAKPEYKDTVSNIRRIFLTRTAYSQV